MNFDEPGLEDLIQNDLHNEMNRILSESDVDDAANSQPNNFLSCPKSSPYPSPLDNTTKFSTPKNSPLDVAVTTEMRMIDTSLIPGGDSSAASSRENIQEISGSFSLHHIDDNFTLPQVTEAGDLSSLTWLTAVDVQNGTQKLPSTQPSTVTLQQHMLETSDINNKLSQNTGKDLLYDSSDQELLSSSQPSSSSGSLVKKTSGAKQFSSRAAEKALQRYAPIQPSYNQGHDCSGVYQQQQQQQRYHLHTEPSNITHGREAGQIGPHRYMYGGMVGHHNHPYPPSMYPGGNIYHPHNPPFMHSRFHHGMGQKVFPKPVYSYSCLIAMALKNSKTGCLPVADIYNYMMENFPYFKTAPDGWKNSVRHNLSLNKCFEKVEKPNGTQRKGCLWALNPAKIAKMEEEVQKWKRKDPESVRRSMSKPEELDRELEEMRQADEEAARRRMLTLSSHGLTAPVPNQHRHYPYNPQYPTQQPHGCPRPFPNSLPSSPQHQQRKHFSPELAQQRFALALARSSSQLPRTSSQPPPISRQMSAPPPIHGRQDSLPNDLCNQITGQGGASSNFISKSDLFQSQNSPNRDQMIGGISEAPPDFCEEHNDFADIDIDESLADLEMLQSTLWDDNISLGSHDQESAAELMTKLSDNDTLGCSSASISTQAETPTSDHMTSKMSDVSSPLATASKQSDEVSPVYDGKTQQAGNYGRELYFNNNLTTSSKPVMLH